MKTKKIDSKLARYYTNLERVGLLCSQHGMPLWEHDTTVDWKRSTAYPYPYKDKCLVDKNIMPGWIGYWGHEEGKTQSIYGRYNTFLIDGIWIYCGRDNAKYMYAFDYEGTMCLEKESSLIRPKPKVLDTIGDVYNYFVGKEEADILPLVTKYNTFRRMKQTALQRILHPKVR